MGAQGCGGKVEARKASLIADVVEQKLMSMNPGERILANLSVSQGPKKLTVFEPNMNPQVFDSRQRGYLFSLRSVG